MTLFSLYAQFLIAILKSGPIHPTSRLVNTIISTKIVGLNSLNEQQHFSEPANAIKKSQRCITGWGSQNIRRLLVYVSRRKRTNEKKKKGKKETAAPSGSLNKILREREGQKVGAKSGGKRGKTHQIKMSKVAGEKCIDSGGSADEIKVRLQQRGAERAANSAAEINRRDRESALLHLRICKILPVATLLNVRGNGASGPEIYRYLDYRANVIIRFNEICAQRDTGAGISLQRKHLFLCGV